jgi:Asparagine synthase
LPAKDGQLSRQWVPRAIAERRKVGFDSPINQWFEGEPRRFLARFLLREDVAYLGLRDGDAVPGLVQDAGTTHSSSGASWPPKAGPASTPRMVSPTARLIGWRIVAASPAASAGLPTPR